MSDYLVGIDLGTTHTVVAYAGRHSGGVAQVFAIDQLIAPGEVAARPLLASMRYHPADGEIAESDRVLPWQSNDADDPVAEAIVGVLAQELGGKVPGRLVSSAKSWLSHAGVDRYAPILPWGAAEDVARVSPVDASASYLRHVRHAWDHRHPDAPLAQQELVLTVPASFDEVARRLTVEAARLAGLPKVRLLEEPQAACYDWLARHADTLDTTLEGIRTLLVCDVGGGTTDLTLIRVEHGQGAPKLVRIGVGNHLMLGGDNMDLALAHVAEGRISASGGRLNAGQLSQLVQQCRSAKERLLAPDAPEQATVTLLGSGARLIGQARSTSLSRDEVAQLVVDGFFPETAGNDRPQQRRAGLVEFGLPYAADPAVTRHLAAFLAEHARALGDALGEAHAGSASDDTVIVPDAVLLNGGVFHGAALAQRLLGVLGDWRGEAPTLLHNAEPDLAVARGAVAYAQARLGQGARIGGGSARSLLLRIDRQGAGEQTAICLLPRGTEEGQEQRLHDRVFALRLGQPVQFNLVASSSDRQWAAGELVDLTQLPIQPLPPMATVLQGAGDSEVQVELAAMLTDVGTLEIDCVATGSSRRWQLEFQTRGQGPDAGGIRSPALPPNFAAAVERLQRAYGTRDSGAGPKESKSLVRDLERLLGRRANWDTGLLRELFGVLWDGAKRRRRSAEHERLWFNLGGFCLRPGYGYPLDDWRVEQLWGIHRQGVQYRTEARNLSEWWILWRRVAGGLTAEQQLLLLDDTERQLGKAVRNKKSAQSGAVDDMLRLLGSLERLSASRKAEVGARLIGLSRKPVELPQRWWALGRLGARVPFYGNAHDVVAPDTAAQWVETLLALDWRTVESAAFAATQLTRMSGDRERDLAPELRTKVMDRLRRERAPDKWIAMVTQPTELDSADESLVFGESLPPGLRLLR